MRTLIRYPDDVWAVMPDVGVGQDAGWVAQQRARAVSEYPDRADLAERCAREALLFRRDGIDTSLYFRPPGLAATAIMHITLADVDVPEGEFVSEQWIPDAAYGSIRPVVSQFETDHCPHGFRIAYVTDQRTADGATLAGIVYALRFNGGIVSVFSELADATTAGLLQWQADPVVESMQLVE